MPGIHLLEQSTIDKIAAGEVVERPSSVVKELVENAIDAGATAVTVEIKDGGISFIRITDNGCGISKDEIPMAFLRHSTSKIKTVEDLLHVTSLGFRGEALSSIAAVSQVELITKPADALTGSRYLIEGSKEVKLEEIGAPNGTTFLVRNLFYNTPARQKFLKSAQTEASYISDFMERLALSRPDISFQFISNNQPKLNTAGNGNLKDVIYRIYGRDIAMNLLEVHTECEFMKVNGFIGKPVISRGNRNFESYFINQRYIKSSLVAKGIEDAYKLHLMQHQYPFTVLHLTMDGTLLDVNVHPSKMELRFSDGKGVYEFLYESLKEALEHKEFIPEVSVEDQDSLKKSQTTTQPRVKAPEPFETKRVEKEQNRLEQSRSEQTDQNGGFAGQNRSEFVNKEYSKDRILPEQEKGTSEQEQKLSEQTKAIPDETPDKEKAAMENLPLTGEQLTLREMPEYGGQFLTQEAKAKHRIIGQVFDTYWLVQFEDKLFIIDQHAAHEKVLFERTMASLEKKEYTSQQLSPPMVVSLNMREEQLLKKYLSEFERLGYEIESFGGKEYAVCAVPGNLYYLNQQQLFIEMLDNLNEESGAKTSDAIIEKIATMSCKAAVKGNQHLQKAEMEHLIEELLTCENPYQCPHGRPTIISMSRYELEKKFKRIV